jgi:hypothetical protein
MDVAMDVEFAVAGALKASGMVETFTRALAPD